MVKKILIFLIIIVFSSCASVKMDTTEKDGTAGPTGSTAGSTADLENSKAPGPDAAPKSSDDVKSGIIVDEPEPAEDLYLETPGKRSMASESAGGGGAAEKRPSSSGLKAGYEDDNRQFNYFINFLKEYSYVPHRDLDVSERIILKLKDSAGLSIPNADIVIKTARETAAAGKSLPDGSFQFNPSSAAAQADRYSVEISAEGFPKKTLPLERNGVRELDISFGGKRRIAEPIPVDIVFVMDTTGSMGEEIDRLKLTIELIYLNLSSLPNDLLIRFGMVLYKDRGDTYDTEIIPLTPDLEKFQDQLALVSAEGGGDYPEDLQEALADTVRKIKWNRSSSGIRLAYVITDATPHLDYPDQQFKYTDAMQAARKMGLKIHTIGTGGLDVSGEYILRQLAQYTGGKYIFLTYGESGESSGGTAGSVSHHTGANFQTDKFESIIIRFTKEEIAFLSSTPLPEDDPYLEALKIESEEKEETLNKLFDMSLGQLISFSSYLISPEDNVGVLPILDDTGNSETAEYFTQQLVLTAAKSKSFAMVERADLNVLLDEMALKLSGLAEGEGIAEIGGVLEAEYLLSSTMYEKGGRYEIFLKLLKVETGEIVSVTKAKLDKNLGL